jgi:Tol biopolymer transport system component
MGKTAAILAIVACAGGAFAQSAGATFKGRNGNLAFSVVVDERGDCGDQGHHYGCGPHFANLFYLRAAGGAAHQITSCDEQRGCLPVGVSWSPDGSQIAYDTNDTVYVSRPDGSHARLIASGRDPAWSPGGRELVVSRPDGLYRVRLRDGRTLRVTEALDERPDWSSRGTIAFVRESGEPGLYTVRPDGARLTRLTTAEDGPRSYSSNPTWSPDGRRVAYVDAQGGLLTVAASGGPPRRVRGVGACCGVAWSPDGRFFALASLTDGIRVIRTTGKLVRTVGPPARGDVVAVAWQPRR